MHRCRVQAYDMSGDGDDGGDRGSGAPGAKSVKFQWSALRTRLLINVYAIGSSSDAPHQQSRRLISSKEIKGASFAYPLATRRRTEAINLPTEGKARRSG